MEYSFTLEKYGGLKSRFTCPRCNHKHQLARYIDLAGHYIADDVGRCNRESKCGYHLKPKDYFEENRGHVGRAWPQQQRASLGTPVTVPVRYISRDVLKTTLKAYEQNTFVKYLRTIFDQVTVQNLINAYGLGTARDGSCIFWQMDDQRRVRTGKVIRYQEDGHRDKTVPPYFIHTRLKIEAIEQCLFGLHLLIVDHGSIGLVESEKTAVIMSGMLPDFTWLATGGKTNLSKVHALKGKNVVAFPDTDAFNEWSDRLTPYGFKVSNALQKHVTNADHGYDLADFVGPQRILGELIRNGQETGEIRKQNEGTRVTTTQEVTSFGLSHKQSSSFKAIADIPEETYTETLKDGRIIQMHPDGFPLDWNMQTTNIR